MNEPDPDADNVDSEDVMIDGPPDGSSGTPEVQPKTNKKKPRAASISRSYPRRSLEDALRIPEAIKEKNGGQPWIPTEVASAVGMGMSTAFYYLTSAARDFGLTEGTRDASLVSITPLGRRAVYPGSDDERTAAIREAFFSIKIFAQLVEYYNGSKLPEEPYRSNTLTTTFKLDATIVDEFVTLFEKNARFAGIGTDWNLTDNGGQTAPLAPGTSASTVVGTPPASKRTGLQCFIAMPFSEKTDEFEIGFFKEVQDALLEPAIIAAGFEAITARRAGSDVIQSTIVNDLLDADLVIADLTEHNPNVLFELGMRMHANKPVALIRAKGTGPIFDVDNLLRVQEYSPNLWPSTVKRDVEALTAHIKGAWDNRETTQTFMQILQRPN
jgi:hypothetical protein